MLQNIFIGQWRVDSIWGNVRGMGWTLLKSYEPDSFIWEFTQECVIDFHHGSIAYKGQLRECFTDSPKEFTKYAYYPKERELYIDRSDYVPGRCRNICLGYLYRAERINKTEYWLYDIEDVYKKPKWYKFRMKVTRSQ